MPERLYRTPDATGTEARHPVGADDIGARTKHST